MTIKRKKKRENPDYLKKLPLLITALLILFFISYGIYVISGLPSIKQLENPKTEFSSEIYSADGVLLGRYSVVNRERSTFDELPSHLINALIASEDRKFYRHRGIDPDRILKATIKNILRFRIREGASTITQQVARNLYLDQSRSLTRKIREVITAIQIERRYSKNEILEMYFNLAYFGNSSYGIATASKQFFDKSVPELTLIESALLVGVLPNPSLYNPYSNPDRALTRRNYVLHSMSVMEFISPGIARLASSYPMEVTDNISPADSNIAPHFVEYVRRQLSDFAVAYGFDIYRDGLTIHTTLDSRMQQHANHAIEKHLASYQEMYDDDTHRIQTGFVALDPFTGTIKAMVGGTDALQHRHGLNRATQIRRQPGSAFKPFVYTAAIDNGIPPWHRLSNEPVTITTDDGTLWQPVNVDRATGGDASLREGLAMSINLIAVRTMMELAPIEQIVQYARLLGISSPLHSYESLSLGTAEVSPLELTSAYGVYAAGGIYSKPFAIERIEDNDGNIIVSFEPETRRVLKPETAYIMTDMLRDVIEYGTGHPALVYIDFPAAGKTGTTQGYADGWFIGYTPDITAGVWVGFDDRRITMSRINGQGARSALPIWAAFMQHIYTDEGLDLEPGEFEIPPGIRHADICPESNKLARNRCPDRITEVMLTDSLPGLCDQHRSVIRAVRSFISRIFR